MQINPQTLLKKPKCTTLQNHFIKEEAIFPVVYMKALQSAANQNQPTFFQTDRFETTS